MAGKFTKGTRLKTISGEAVIESWLAEGGQGDVYRISYSGEQKALKWYKPGGMGRDPESFYSNLLRNVHNGPPSDTFLWPLDITLQQPPEYTFGYVMDLKPDGYHEVSDFMLTNVRFSSYKAAVDAALKIVSAYRILHNKGYSYQDLNDGNFFIHPVTGDVRIADNDNVVPNSTQAGIVGKPRYMAPEIVTGQKETPDTQSDLFSMAVILFILFFLNHPLEGKRSLTPAMTPAHQEFLYGTDPLFIMDPDNKENAPDPVIHSNVLTIWPCLPSYMQDLFCRAFSQKAFKNPNLRPTEYEWMKNLVKFRSEIVECACGNEIFCQEGTFCEKCRREVYIPHSLLVQRNRIPGVAGSRIYKCQLETCDADEALDIIGRVVANPVDMTRLALKNTSAKFWRARTPSGQEKPIVPGSGVPLKAGITISITTRTGTETIEIIKNVHGTQNI